MLSQLSVEQALERRRDLLREAEARHRVADAFADGSRQPGRLGQVMFHVGRRLEVSGKRIQMRYGTRSA
jgi:hypothetical protein